MPKFQFVNEITVTVAFEIEAADLREAMALAQDAPTQRFCHHCSNPQVGTWYLSEFDGDLSASRLVDLFVDGQSPENFEEIAAAWESDGHECPLAPLGRCVYDEDEDPARDDCTHCHEPYERK